MAKAKAVTIRLPHGTFKYPYLLRPDTFKGVETYKTILRVPLPEAQPIVDQLNTMLEKAMARDTVLNDGDAVNYKEPYLPFTVDETAGFVEFTTKLKKLGGAQGNQFEQRPAIFDSQNPPQPITDAVIKGGSKGTVIVDAFRWGNPDELDKEGKAAIGISLRLKAAQITEVCSEIVVAAEDYGFSAVEGGFDASATVDDGHGDAEVKDGDRETY